MWYDVVTPELQRLRIRCPQLVESFAYRSDDQMRAVHRKRPSTFSVQHNSDRRRDIPDTSAPAAEQGRHLDGVSQSQSQSQRVVARAEIRAGRRYRNSDRRRTRLRSHVSPSADAAAEASAGTGNGRISP